MQLGQLLLLGLCQEGSPGKNFLLPPASPQQWQFLSIAAAEFHLLFSNTPKIQPYHGPSEPPAQATAPPHCSSPRPVELFLWTTKIDHCSPRGDSCFCCCSLCDILGSSFCLFNSSLTGTILYTKLCVYNTEVLSLSDWYVFYPQLHRCRYCR